MQIPVISRKGQAKPYGSIPRINWDHPLAQGLVFYGYDTGAGVVLDLAGNRKQLTVGTVDATTASPYGSAVAYNTDGTRFFNSDAVIRNLTTFTWATALVATSALPANSCVFGRGANNNTSNPYDNAAFQCPIGGQMCAIVSTVEGGLGFTQVGLTAITPGYYVSLAATAKTSGGINFYAQGDPNGGPFYTANSSNHYQSVNTNDPICFSGDSNASAHDTMAGFVYYGAYWNRELSVSEIRTLHQDPYCFLIYPEDEIFATLVGVTAGASVGAAAGIGTATAIGVGIVSDPGQSTMLPQLRASRGPMQRMLSLLNFDLPSTTTVAAGDGGAAGIGTAAAVGTAVTVSVGAASGVGEATGVGAATTAAVGSGAGAGTATSTGASTAIAVGAGSGAGSAAAVGTGIAPAVGSASGNGAAAATGVAASSAAGAGSGTGSATGTGLSTATAVGAGAGIGRANGLADSGVALGAASGNGRATGVGVALFLGVGSASGTGAAAAVGLGAANAVGAGSGTGTANAVAQSIFNAAGAASGTGAAAAVGRSTAGAVGAASGVGSAAAVGSTAAPGSVGSAAGTGAAAAVGRSTAAAVGSAVGIGSAAGVSSVVFAGIVGTLAAVERADRARFVVAQPPADPGVINYGWPDVIVRRRL